LPYPAAEGRRFFAARRAMLFSSLMAEASFVRETSFFDSLTASDSFELTNLAISRLSPVLAI
jgi:hypothetical protein